MRISKKPIEKTFVIETEEYGKGTITIRQARVGDQLRRQDLVSEASIVINDEFLGQEIKQKINQAELKRFDIFLVLVGSDIEEEDSDGNFVGAYFKFNNGHIADQAEFNVAYGRLPIEVADTIYEKVLEVNPHWKVQNGNDMGE